MDTESHTVRTNVLRLESVSSAIRTVTRYANTIVKHVSRERGHHAGNRYAILRRSNRDIHILSTAPEKDNFQDNTHSDRGSLCSLFFSRFLVINEDYWAANILYAYFLWRFQYLSHG